LLYSAAELTKSTAN